MGAGEGSAASDGAGRKGWSFLDGLVAFVVAVFQPIFHVLASVISPPKSNATSDSRPTTQPGDQPKRQQQQQQQQQHQTSASQHSRQPTLDPSTSTSTSTPPPASASTSTPAHARDLSTHSPDLQNGGGDEGATRMQPRLLNQLPLAATGRRGPTTKGTGQPDIKNSLSRTGPFDGHADAKQENVPVSEAAVPAGLPHQHRDLVYATVGPGFRVLGEEQAKEDRQEQLTLPPPSEPATLIEQLDQAGSAEPEDPVEAAERALNHYFMDQALDMARLSLKTNETPVGCVLVHDGRVVARGMNATNITRNGTRHAELMALTALLSFTPEADFEQDPPRKPKRKSSKGVRPGSQQAEKPSLMRTYSEQEWGDVDPTDGHIYPYGQKLHPAPRVDRSLIKECTLYVTVEPCVMCASMLRQYGIRKVYFGAVNDKFGGTGGVFCIHMNSDPVHAATAPATPTHRPVANLLTRPTLPHKSASCASSINGSQDGSGAISGEVKSVNRITFIEPPIPVSNMSMGHGGNVEDGFEAEGGWGRDEAVNLLRQFYVQENGRAPVPRKKEGRAARLAAMMESQGMTTEGTALEGLVQQDREVLEQEEQAGATAGSASVGLDAEAGSSSSAEEEDEEDAFNFRATDVGHSTQLSPRDGMTA